jgi:hypothetical protein
VPEHPEQQVPGSLHLGVEVVDGLADGLVDGLVEPDDVFRSRLVERTGLDPQPEDAGAQRAVLGDELGDVEAAPRPQNRVRLRHRVRGARHHGGPPFGLLPLRLLGLGGGEVLRHSLQDLLRVVTEGERRHARRGREQGGGERLPLRHNGLHVMQDKLR